MILVIDIGNTNAVIGAFEGDKKLFLSRVATDRSKMSDEYAVTIKSILSLYGVDEKKIEGVIISSVVPPLSRAFKNAVKRIDENLNVMTVGPGIKTGLNIKIDNPAQLGADLVCVSVAALEKYPVPSLVIDMGTATTISAIDRNRNFLGGSIIPGVRIGLEALVGRTAQLQQISLDGDVETIGKNTADCMKSGIVLGAACMIDGLVERYKEILGEDLTVVITGGISGDILPHCKQNIIQDNDLLIDGLRLIYEKNK